MRGQFSLKCLNPLQNDFPPRTWVVSGQGRQKLAQPSECFSGVPKLPQQLGMEAGREIRGPGLFRCQPVTRRSPNRITEAMQMNIGHLYVEAGFGPVPAEAPLQ